MQPQGTQPDQKEAREVRVHRPELTAIDGGLHLPGSALLDEALNNGKTRLRRGIRATLLGGVMLLGGMGLSIYLADVWFLGLGVLGAAGAEGAFVCREAGLLRAASGLRSVVFLAAVVLLAAGLLVGTIKLL